MLDYLVTHVADPRYAEQLGVSRREAVRMAVSIWSSGAMAAAPARQAGPPRTRPR